jgi:peptide/nickel transport system substrate-binding protein
MDNRGGIFTFFFFLFMSIIILLQIVSMVQSDRFFDRLNQLEHTFINTANTDNQERRAAKTTKQEYPGDEGDWLIWAFRVEPKTLSPISAENDSYARWITIPYIFEPLLFYNYDTLEYEPLLAEKYEVSKDGLEITFHLRGDIYFSDGKPVTSDDVIFTYETVTNPKVDAANIANFYVDVERAVRIDERTVKFVMKKPYFKAVENLSFWDMGILPKHIYQFKDAEQFNRRISNPVGSGPYVFEKWETGKEIVLRRNENYWGQKPKLKKIVYRFVTNTVAAVQALRSHEVDIVIPESDQFADLVKDADFNKDFYCLSYWSPGTPFYYIGWNQSTVFFKDQRVRLAMTLIIDRERIVNQLLKGYGKTITGPFFINSPQNDPNIKPWPCDLEKARQLLTQAGWVDTNGDGIREKDGVPFRFKFTYANDSTLYNRLATFLKDEAEKVGIEIIPEPLEWSVVISRITDRNFESMVMGWGGDILEDPYQIWHSSQIGNRGSNYVGFNNRQADSIMEQARRTMNEDKRNKLFHQLHQILHEQQPYTFLFTRPTFRLIDKRFKNVNIYKLGPKYWQWYVPEKEQRYKN